MNHVDEARNGSEGQQGAGVDGLGEGRDREEQSPLMGPRGDNWDGLEEQRGLEGREELKDRGTKNGVGEGVKKGMEAEEGGEGGVGVDEALTMLGAYGRWQLVFFVILSIGMMFPGCWHTLAYVFQAYTPPHHCRVSPGASLNASIPWDEHTGAYSSCLVYADSTGGAGGWGGNGTRAGGWGGNETRRCSEEINEWEYLGDVTDTIVSEYTLVCERAYLKRTTQLVTALGIMVGTAVFAPLIDYWGRRPTFLALTLVMVGVGVCNAFVTNYYLYLIVRFLTGALRPGYGLAAFILACELFPAKQRTFAGIIIEDFWGVAMCCLALFMYLLPAWRNLQLLVSLFGLLAIPLYWFLPESIPWLVMKGRVPEAEAILQRAARFNRLPDFPSRVLRAPSVPPIEGAKHGGGEVRGRCSMLSRLLRCRRSSAAAPAAYTIWDVLRHARLRFFTFAMGTLWFVNSTVYYGMTLHTSDLAGNRYVNLFISGLVEIPAYTASYFIINRWGRRLPLVGFHVLTGVFLILSQVVPKHTADGVSLDALRTAFMMIGKFGITASYGIVYIYAPELFPTTVRSQAMGVAAINGRIGSMLAPFTSSLNDIRPWLTSVIFGVVSVCGGLMALTLPETNHRPLPQTIDEIDAWFRRPATEGARGETGAEQVPLTKGDLGHGAVPNGHSVFGDKEPNGNRQHVQSEPASDVMTSV